MEGLAWAWNGTAPTEPTYGPCCYNGSGPEPIEWATAVGWCVYSGLEVASKFVGLAAILCWFCAQYPQLRENYVLKSAEALSARFLLLWTLGDSTNLIGCAILIQMDAVIVTQLYLAAYFCLIDTILWIQYFYYNYYYPKHHLTLPPSTTSINSLADGSGVVSSEPATANESEESQALLGSSQQRLMAVGLVMLLATNVALPLMRASGGAASSFATGRVLLQSDEECGVEPEGSSDSAAIIGQVFAWTSAALYLGSRTPQIYHNGLAMTLFMFAVCGNLATVVSILLWSIDSEYLVGQLPYLLGSGGTLVFDALIFFQFWRYRYSRYRELQDLDAIESAQSKG